MITVHKEIGDEGSQLNIKCKGSELDIGRCLIINDTCTTNMTLGVACGKSLKNKTLFRSTEGKFIPL
jgi:hypothetical protein